MKGTGDRKDTGIIRLEFPGAPNAKDQALQEIDWDEFFEKFDDNGLAFLYQETTAGGQKSNFNKLVRRDESSGSQSRSQTHSGSSKNRKSSGGSRRRTTSGDGDVEAADMDLEDRNENENMEEEL